MNGHRRATVILAFALGTLLSLIPLGAVTLWLGRVAGDLGFSSNYPVALLCIVAGLYLLDWLPLPWSGRGLPQPASRGAGTALWLGMAFGLALGPCAFAWIAPLLGVAWMQSGDGIALPLLLLTLFAAGHCGGVLMAAGSLDRVQRWLDALGKGRGIALGRAVCGVLHVVPQGRVAYWIHWSLLGLGKEGWGDVHILFGGIFIVTGVLHLYFNWKPFKKYLAERVKGHLELKRELLTSVAATALLVVAAIGDVPPVSWVFDLNATIKDSWAREPGHEPPFGHAEEVALPVLARRTEFDLESGLTALQAASMRVDDPRSNLERIARDGGIDPGLSARAASEHYTFGLRRAEILAALFNAATLIGIAIYLALEAASRLADPPPVSGAIVVALAALGLLVNGLSVWLLHDGPHQDMNRRAALLHLLGDALTSLAVLTGGGGRAPPAPVAARRPTNPFRSPCAGGGHGHDPRRRVAPRDRGTPARALRYRARDAAIRMRILRCGA